jgi:hypothetical protein
MSKYQYFGLILFLLTCRPPNSTQRYSKKSLRNVHLKGLKQAREEKVQFLLQSASKFNRKNVKMLKIFLGPKTPCLNIADERYFQKNNYFYFFVL